MHVPAMRHRTTISGLDSPMTDLTMPEFPECEQFAGHPKRYAWCRDERGDTKRTNIWRAGQGLTPIGNATTPPAGSQEKPAKQRKLRGLGDVVDAVTTATGIKSAVHATATALGFDCGCGKRRDALNKAVPFGGGE